MPHALAWLYEGILWASEPPRLMGSTHVITKPAAQHMISDSLLQCSGCNHLGDERKINHGVLFATPAMLSINA